MIRGSKGNAQFKLFGLMGLTLVFTIGIGVFMTKHAVTRQN